jgi:hypothetical protein
MKKRVVFTKLDIYASIYSLCSSNKRFLEDTNDIPHTYPNETIQVSKRLLSNAISDIFCSYVMARKSSMQWNDDNDVRFVLDKHA